MPLLQPDVIEKADFGGGRSDLADMLGRGRLAWWPELGLGYYPVTDGVAPYDAAYFERFAKQADSDIGRKLMAARCDFVCRNWQGGVIDIGIGSGAFIEAMRARSRLCFGYDVNPAALAWLADKHLFCDPYKRQYVPAITLWDVLEHIPDFRPLLANVLEFVFVSLPVFRDAAHVLASKHYRKDEHCWYFTRQGLIDLFVGLGFTLVEHNEEETWIGREGIESFAFRRKR